uniref:Uncharacterized protein n=1 Tax=Phlebotomus papatasi TaxID=29031 RepID=A0A1B0F087_PHLPP
MPSLKGQVGVTITPKAFRVCLTPRPLAVPQVIVSDPVTGTLRNYMPTKLHPAHVKQEKKKKKKTLDKKTRFNASHCV